VTQEVCAAPACRPTRSPTTPATGAECRTIWSTGAATEYAGIGPGAHGRLLLADGRHATATEKNPEAWLARVEDRGDGLVVDDLLTAEEEGDEMLLMGLRLVEGIDVARYRAISGRHLDDAQLAELVRLGMVEQMVDGRLRATRAGFFVLDAVVADLAA
jgi:coproporphyrinogen III oxidase-like Fe-S oxidoreductase